MSKSDEALPLPTDKDFRIAAAETRQQLYARRPATADVHKQLDQLHSKMIKSTECYETGDLADQRFAVLEALDAIQDFLIGQGFSAFVLTPARRPIAALDDQENNRIDPMFAQRKPGRAKNSLDRHNRTGQLAALAQYWIETHPSGNQPAQLRSAARKFSGDRWCGRVEPAELKRARDTVSQEAKDHPAVHAAAGLRKLIDEYAEHFGASRALAVTIGHLNHMPISSDLGNWSTIKG